MDLFLEVLKCLKAALPTLNVTNWLGLSGLFEAASIGMAATGVGFGAGSVLLGIGGLLGGFGLFQGVRDVGRASQKASQALESIANDISRMTFAINVVLTEVSIIIPKIGYLLDSLNGLVHIASITLCIVAAILVFKQYKDISRPTLRQTLYRFIGYETTDDAKWMMHCVYLLRIIALVFLVSFIRHYLVPFIIVITTGCIILLVVYYHQTLNRLLEIVGRMIYAQNVPNNWYSLLVYEIFYISSLCIAHIILHILELRTSFLLCTLSMCLARCLTNTLAYLYFK